MSRKIEAHQLSPTPPNEPVVISLTKEDLNNQKIDTALDTLLNTFRDLRDQIITDRELTDATISRSNASYPSPQAWMIWATSDGIKRKISAVIDAYGPLGGKTPRDVNITIFSTAWVMEDNVKYAQDALGPFLSCPVSVATIQEFLDEAFVMTSIWNRGDLVDSRILDQLPPTSFIR